MIDNTTYTKEQQEKIREAVYKINNAYQIFAEVAEEMNKNKQWRGYGDIQRIVSDLRELIIEDGGSLNHFIKTL
ncbi:MAG: hypothetical protein RQ856_06400 [Candidatus Izemoplasmatales bacterium]|nr:hypothetical protein [Candidatus Izemoplasmatales bacterium]